MSNNVLFIRNRKTGEYTWFLKTFGEGWEIRKTAEQIEKDVAELFDNASFGNCYGAATDLELVTENDPRYTEVDGLLVYSSSHSDALIPTAMPIPTRAEHRALFAEALNRAGYFAYLHSYAAAIRAAVEVVLGDPANDTLRPTTARHRAQFLALADAIEGGD